MSRFLWWSHTGGGFVLGVEAVDAKAASEIVRRLDPKVLHWSGQVIELNGELFKKCVEAGMSELTGKFKPTNCPPFLGTVLTSKYDAVPTPAEDPSPAVADVPVAARPADDEARPVPSLDGGSGSGGSDVPVVQVPGGQVEIKRDPTPVQTSSREVIPFWKLV